MLVLDFIYAVISTIGFAVIFNIPKKNIFHAGITGGIGWTIYKLLLPNNNLILAVFMGALVVGFLGEIMARIFKTPVTIFIIPGIIPLVPGYGLYYTMLKVIEKDYMSAADVGTEALLVAVTIASAIVVSSSLGWFYKGYYNRKNSKRKISQYS